MQAPIDDRDEHNKEEILQATATLSQSGVKISVEQIHGREDLLTQLVELTAEFRAANRAPGTPQWQRSQA